MVLLMLQLHPTFHNEFAYGMQILRASSTDSLLFSLHVESHFFNYTSTNFLFFLYFYSFILTFFFLSPHISFFSFLLRFSPPVTHRPHYASLLDPPDPHPLSKTNKNHHQSTTLLPKSIQKIHLPNPSTHSNLPVKPTKNHPKSNQITKLRLSSTPGQDQHSTPTEIGASTEERGLEKMGEKRKEKRGEREKVVVKMERRKKNKKIKNGRLRFFYSMKSYSSFSFVKSYGKTLAI